MELEIVRADPAGNITVFVLNPPGDPKARAAAARALLADPALKAEQVGFVLNPDSGAGRRLWRLEMAGGEFCGNGARSFGLYAARQSGLSGKHTLNVEISGLARPLPVRVDTAAETAEAEMPLPLEESAVERAGRRFPAYVFEGITHVIAEDLEPDAALIPPLAACFDAKGPLPAALGVMFWDTRNRRMRPVVWVRAAGTTVFESSCGSGSAAFGAWVFRDAPDGDHCFALAQPGGIITVQVTKQGGRIRRLSIGGKVSLDGPRRWRG